MSKSKPRRKLLITDEAVRSDDAVLRSLQDHFDLVDDQSSESDILVLRLREAAPDGTAHAHLSAESLAARALERADRPICLADHHGQVVWRNLAFDQLDDAIRLEISEICRSISDSAAAEPAANSAQARNRKVEIQTDDETFYDVMLSPVTDPDLPPDEGRFVLAVLSDTSRARQLQRQLDAIDAAGSELVRIETEAVASLNTAERLALLEDNIIQYTRDLLHFDHFNIFILEHATNRLRPVMMVGMPEEVAEYELYAAPTGSGISGTVAYSARSCICPDVTQDPRYLPGLENAGSSLSVPLLLHDKVVGVFNVEAAKTNAFTEEDRQFAEIFGRYVALALNILDLLVVERVATSGTVAVNVIGEINQPLNDISSIAESLREKLLSDPVATQALDRVITLVGNVRTRVRDVAQGPRSILGAREALESSERDPLLVNAQVVVVDDEPNIRNTIASVMKRRGAQVTVFDSGATAIEFLHSAHPGNVGLVLSDISMPDRNGYEVFAAARKSHPGVPVILMTGFGYDPHHSIVRASQEGLQCVLFKPFQIERLLEEVNKALTTVNSSS